MKGDDTCLGVTTYEHTQGWAHLYLGNNKMWKLETKPPKFQSSQQSV